MKTFLSTVLVLFISIISFAQKARVAEVANAKGAVRFSYYCPMHPTQISDTPGNCAKCGMAMVQKHVFACPMHADVISNTPGKCQTCGKPLVQLSAKEQMKEAVTGEFTCPMHGDVVSAKAGKCPKCGMELIKNNKH